MLLIEGQDSQGTAQAWTKDLNTRFDEAGVSSKLETQGQDRTGNKVRGVKFETNCIQIVLEDFLL